MKEGAPKNESFDKVERLKEGEEIYAALVQYDNRDLNSEQHKHKKALTMQLDGVMMDMRLGWNDLVDHKLPWDPRLELRRQQQNTTHEQQLYGN